MELREYIAIGLKWWWLLVISTILGATVAFLFSRSQAPVYEASTTIIVGNTIRSTDLSTSDILLSERLARTYADMARRQPVLQGVIDSISLRDDWQSLKRRVSVSPVQDTQLLEISVEAGSPEEARVTADAVAQQLIQLSPTALQNQETDETQRLVRERLESLQTRINAGQVRREALEKALNGANGSLSADKVTELQTEANNLDKLIADWENTHTQLLIYIAGEKSPNYLAIVEAAQANPGSIRPKVMQNTMLAAVVGLLLAMGIIFLLEYLDDTLKSTEEMNQTLGITALGAVTRIGGETYPEKLLTGDGIFSTVGEAYRMVRSNVQFMSIDKPLKSLMITSPSPNEGKSVTVSNLGVVMAQAGYKTIIVDSDLRRPVQYQIFQQPNQGGLTELLRSPEIEVEAYLKETGVENLRLLTSGTTPPNPSELLNSQRMGQVISSLTQVADVVIFDSPPALVVADAGILSGRVDGVVLVLRAGQTRYEAARQAILHLNKAGANVLGGVLNRISAKKGGYYYNYYHSYAPNAGAPSLNGKVPLPTSGLSGLKAQWGKLPFKR